MKVIQVQIPDKYKEFSRFKSYFAGYDNHGDVKTSRQNMYKVMSTYTTLQQKHNIFKHIKPIKYEWKKYGWRMDEDWINKNITE